MGVIRGRRSDIWGQRASQVVSGVHRGTAIRRNARVMGLSATRPEGHPQSESTSLPQLFLLSDRLPMVQMLFEQHQPRMMFGNPHGPCISRKGAEAAGSGPRVTIYYP